MVILKKSWTVTNQINFVLKFCAAVEAIEVSFAKILQAISQKTLHFNHVIRQISIQNIICVVIPFQRWVEIDTYVSPIADNSSLTTVSSSPIYIAGHR